MVREHKIICFMFRNNLLRNNTVGESGGPLAASSKSAKSDVSKMLFPDIGKITNRGSKLHYHFYGAGNNGLQNVIC